MATFTSSLLGNLLEKLALHAKKLSLPKNKLLENSLDHLKRSEYIKSYRRAANDKDILPIAEEGMHEYLIQIENVAG